MSRILRPLRTTCSLLLPRPSIQAWRTARTLATQASSSESSSALPPSNIEDIDEFIYTGSVGSRLDPLALAEEPWEREVEKHRDLEREVDEEKMEADLADAAAATMEEVGKPVVGKRGPVGVVVSAGKMQKTVKVRVPGQKWNKHLRKYFREDTNHLVRDENGSVKIGDVVSLTPFRTSKHVHHAVQEILAPFGTPITERPKVHSEIEREKEYLAKVSAKRQRSRLRKAAVAGSQRAAEKLKFLGFEVDGEGNYIKDLKKGGKTKKQTA